MWVLNSLANLAWGTTPNTELEDEESIDSEDSQKGQSAELQGTAPQQTPEPSSAQSEELQEFIEAVEGVEQYSHEVAVSVTGPYGKQMRKRLKALKKDKVTAQTSPEQLKGSLKNRIVELQGYEETLAEAKIQYEREQEHKEELRRQEEERLKEEAASSSKAPAQVELEVPQPKLEAEEEDTADWTDHVTASKLETWRECAEGDTDAKELLRTLERVATGRITLTGKSNKSKRARADQQIRSLESQLDERVEQAEIRRQEALAKPAVPSHVKVLAWNEYTGFKYPADAEVEATQCTAVIRYSALKHPEDELGRNPSSERVTAYFGKFTEAAKAFAEGYKRGAYAAETTYTVNGWKLIGKKLPGNERYEVYHADTGYERSPWRNRSYRG